MGSKLSKAVRDRARVKADATVAPASGHHDIDTNRQPCQESEALLRDQGLNVARIPFSRDDITVATSTSPPLILQRRNSAPSPPVVPRDIRSMERSQSFTASREQQLRDLVLRLPPVVQIPGFGEPTLPPPPPTSYTPPPPPPPPQDPQCLICCTTLPKEKDKNYAKDVIKPCRSCKSEYCVTCVKNMFIEACKDMTRMPPRCCVPINLHHAKPHLTEEETKLFRMKYEEWSTPKPLYCPVPVCSAFIPERLLPKHAQVKDRQRVDSGIGTPDSDVFACPTCDAGICTGCRQTAHLGSICSILEYGLDADTAALLKKWGYKQCPKCRHGLKRMYGCNHMECRCGAHFCWSCLKNIDECDGGCYEDDDAEDYDDDEDEDEGASDDDSESDISVDEDDISDEEDDERSTAPPPTASMVTQPLRLTDPNYVHVTSIEDLPPLQTEPPIHEPRMADSATQTALEDVSTLLQPVPHDAPTAPQSIPQDAPTPPQPIPARNLDGGGASRWAGTHYNFGDEPSNDIQDRAWDCKHEFNEYTISFAAALTSPHATDMECVKCWCTVHPLLDAPQTEAKIVPASAGRARGRGIARARARYAPPRGLFRADATIGTAPHLTATISPLSQSVPARQPSPMEDVQFSERIVDTYGNVITTTPVELKRRASFDNTTSFPVSTPAPSLKTIKSQTPVPSIFHPSPPPFSLAHECRYCNILVCASCRDSALELQEARGLAEQEREDAAMWAEQEREDAMRAEQQEESEQERRDRAVREEEVEYQARQEARRYERRRLSAGGERDDDEAGFACGMFD